MKIPLHYQMSEYDCGPTTMLNAISYLFDVEEIPPEVIRNVMLYSLDCYSDEGRQGEMGTSRTAMMFLCNWLNGYGKVGRIPVSGTYLSGNMVNMDPEGRIVHALRCGGVVILRVIIDVWHYILVTGIDDRKDEEGDFRFQVFDPYFDEETREFTGPGIELAKGHPKEYNKIISSACFEGSGLYTLGEDDEKEAVLLYNGRTQLTEEKTIEYFI